MSKKCFLSCALCFVFVLSFHSFILVVFAEYEKENVAVEQTEQSEQSEQSELGQSTDTTAAPSETASTETESVATKSDGPKQPKTPVSASSAGLKPVGVTSANVKKASDVATANKPLTIDGLVLTDAERKVFELTNAERQKRGLPALRLDRRLMESARRQANWMARTGIFRHGNSGVAENIAMGQRSSREVVVDWMNSVGHFRNMMNRSYGTIGIGAFRGKNGALYWCQQFSR